MLKPVIVSAPFGNWFSYPGATSTLGTFTLHAHGGMLYRLWRCLRTLRWSRAAGGWVNRLGLPNPGIESLYRVDGRGKAVSIHGFNKEEWFALVCALKGMDCRLEFVEFNLSCPNVGHKPSVDEVLPAVWLAQQWGFHVCAKLPPVRWMDYARPLHTAGVRMFHACNTISTPNGGLSGPTLKQFSLWAVEQLKDEMDGVTVIGGGGVTSEQDFRDYRNAGADAVAVASVLLNPLRWRTMRRLIGDEVSRRTAERSATQQGV